MTEAISPDAERLLAEVDAVDWTAFCEDEDGAERLSCVPGEFRALMNNPDGSLRRLFDASGLDTSYAGMYRNSHVRIVSFLLRFLKLPECRNANHTLRWLGGVAQGVSYCDPRAIDPPHLVNRLFQEARPLFVRLMHAPDQMVRAMGASVFLELSRPNHHTTPLPMADNLRKAGGTAVLNVLAEFEGGDSWRAISLARFHNVGTAAHAPDLVAMFLATGAKPGTRLAAAVAAAQLAGPDTPAAVVEHLRAALPEAVAGKYDFQFGTEITRKEIPRWVRNAIWHLGAEKALPILIGAMNSAEAGSSLDAVSDVIGFLQPWHTEGGGDVTWRSIAKYKIAALTPRQRTFLNAVADLPADREPQSGWVEGLATGLKHWGLPADPDKLRKKLTKLPDAEPALPTPPGTELPLEPMPALVPSEEAIEFRARRERIKSFDWGASNDPAAMLDWLRDLKGRWTANHLSHRFAVACCRRVESRFVTDRAKPILDLIEEILDEIDNNARSKKMDRLRSVELGGWLDSEDMGADGAVRELFTGLYSPRGLVRWPVVLGVLGQVAWECRQALGASEGIVQADLLRCVYGHPPAIPEFDPAWRTEVATGLAAGIIADRAFDRMPILADALEETGCTDTALLAHLRDPGPHCRGCRALEEVLSRR